MFHNPPAAVNNPEAHERLLQDEIVHQEQNRHPYLVFEARLIQGFCMSVASIVKVNSLYLNYNYSYDTGVSRGENDIFYKRGYQPPSQISVGIGVLNSLTSITTTSLASASLMYGLYNLGKGEYARGLKWTAAGVSATIADGLYGYYAYTLLSNAAESNGYQKGYAYLDENNSGSFVRAPSEPPSYGNGVLGFKIADTVANVSLLTGTVLYGFFRGRKARQIAEEKMDDEVNHLRA